MTKSTAIYPLSAKSVYKKNITKQQDIAFIMSQPLEHTVCLQAHFSPKTLTQLGINTNVLQVHCTHEPTSLPKTGIEALLGKLPLGNNNPIEMDINIGCGLYNAAGDLIDMVWYGKTRDDIDSIRHEGDSFHGLTQTASIINELLSIRLLKLSPNVSKLVFFVHSQHNQPLAKAIDGKVTLQDNESNVIHHLDFNSLDDTTSAVCLWQILRMPDDWRIESIMQSMPHAQMDNLIKAW